MKEYDSDAIGSGGNDSSDVDLALIVIQMKRGGGGGSSRKLQLQVGTMWKKLARWGWVMQFLNGARKASDHKLVVATAFVDFRKAFNCVSHSFLLPSSPELKHKFVIEGNLLS